MSETEQVGVSRPERDDDPPSDRAGEPAVEVLSERPGEQVTDEATSEVGESTAEEIRLDVIFDILKNQRRRHVLRYLREHETTTLSDLAEHVAALENEKDVRSLTSSERKRVYVGLYQCHLPRMSDAGVIDFDSDRGRIELRDSAEQLDEYLDVEDGPSRPWPLYQLSLAIGGGALYAAVAVALGPTAPVAALVVPALVVAVSACALAEWREMSTDEAN